VYAEFVLACEYPDYVESQGIEVRVAVGKVLLGEGAEGGLFVWGNGFQRISESRTAPQLHFHEDEDVVFAQDQVDLPVARPVVAFDELIAAPGEVTKREVLTPGSGGLLFQSPTPV
jgi:hypothetical protein